MEGRMETSGTANAANKNRFDKLRREYFDLKNSDNTSESLRGNKRRFNEMDDDTKKDHNAMNVTLKQLKDKAASNSKQYQQDSNEYSNIRFTNDIKVTDPKYKNLEIHCNLLFKNIEQFSSDADARVQDFYVKKNELRFEKYITKKD